MLEVIQSEFFWGIVIGMALSIVSGFASARFTASMQKRAMKRTVFLFCADCMQNIHGILAEMKSTRERTRGIHRDFLTLLDAELEVYRRNREHIIHLPAEQRTEFRNFMNEIGIKKAALAYALDNQFQYSRMASQLQTSGNATQAKHALENASSASQEANRIADGLIDTSNNSQILLDKIRSNKAYI